MRLLRLLVATVVTTGVSVFGVMPQAHASATYVSGGTVVTRAAGQTAVDNGFVICNGGAGVGIGGFCVGFGGGDSIEVIDQVAGRNVAFQACIDNNGDGICTSPDFGDCADVTFFSHDDDGSFKNPVGPMPTGFTDNCRGGFPGYVVFLCEGTHATELDPHVHTAGAGTGYVTTGGQGSGTFCGGTIVQSRKPYLSEHLNLPGGGGPDDSGYDGGCRLTLVGDGSDDPQTTLTGAVNVLVAANSFGTPSPTTPISAECDLYRDAVFQQTLLTAKGTGIAVNAKDVTLNGSPSSVYTVCERVTVGGRSYTNCQDTRVTPVVPEPIEEAVEMVGYEVKSQVLIPLVDPVLCPLLAQLAPGISGVADITYEGDVYVLGERLLDCPPYV